MTFSIAPVLFKDRDIFLEHLIARRITDKETLIRYFRFLEDPDESIRIKAFENAPHSAIAKIEFTDDELTPYVRALLTNDQYPHGRHRSPQQYRIAQSLLEDENEWNRLVEIVENEDNPYSHLIDWILVSEAATQQNLEYVIQHKPEAAYLTRVEAGRPSGVRCDQTLAGLTRT